jgi:hypothetical protein
MTGSVEPYLLIFYDNGYGKNLSTGKKLYGENCNDWAEISSDKLPSGFRDDSSWLGQAGVLIFPESL